MENPFREVSFNGGPNGDLTIKGMKGMPRHFLIRRKNISVYYYPEDSSVVGHDIPREGSGTAYDTVVQEKKQNDIRDAWQPGERVGCVAPTIASSIEHKGEVVYTIVSITLDGEVWNLGYSMIWSERAKTDRG